MGMKSTVLNKRYAKALLALAVENNMLERSYGDMQQIHAVFVANKTLKVLMKSPVIRVARKQSVLNHLFEKRVHPLILAYMLIIVRKQRGHMLDGIAGAYLRVYKQYLGIETVRITTAKPLDDALRQKALLAARKMTVHEIAFEEEVDPGIIGGFVLDLDDKQYNASVQYRFARIKKLLMNY